MFYTQMAIAERWSVRLLRERIDSMLFERTALSKQPEKLIRQELEKNSTGAVTNPDLVFRDPYILDFLGLKELIPKKIWKMRYSHRYNNLLLNWAVTLHFSQDKNVLS